MMNTWQFFINEPLFGEVLNFFLLVNTPLFILSGQIIRVEDTVEGPQQLHMYQFSKKNNRLFLVPI